MKPKPFLVPILYNINIFDVYWKINKYIINTQLYFDWKEIIQ
jgi:hypothetical protein